MSRITNPHDNACTVRVYADSPKWDEVDKWFKLADWELRELSRGSVRVWSPDSLDGELVPVRESATYQRTLEWLHLQMPDCVLIY